MAKAEPRPSRLGQRLRQPGARERVGWAVASLLGAGLATIAVLGVLLIWHVRRRARLIRERLGPPRAARLPEFDPVPKSEPENEL